MTTLDRSVFWPQSLAAGFLATATITSGGTTATYSVSFSQPDQPRFDGRGRSTDYKIEYQAADLPSLAENDAVTIDGVLYRVREDPFVEPGGNAADGYFKHALLTKV